MNSKKIVPVILSGGSGSRLWPLSRKYLPKQFLRLGNSEYSLLQDTLLRLTELDVHTPIVICNEEHRFLVAEQLHEIGIEQSQIILEPEGKNTAPAVAMAAHLLENKDSIMAVFPADHKINDTKAFHEALLNAAEAAQQNYLVTFGIVPRKPETGYGYIKSGQTVLGEHTVKVEQFVEKPDLASAKEFLDAGCYYWNSGMFVFTAKSYLSELQKFSPEIFQGTLNVIENSEKDLDFVRVNKKQFAECPSDSIDYAVMEHTKAAVMVPVECHWTDLGSWHSIWESQTKDEQGNALIGDVLSLKTNNSVVHGHDRLIVTVGMDDCVVVDTKDAVLVAHKNEAQTVKQVVQELQKNQREEIEYHQLVYRPWGYYENLIESELYKVKRIMVHPGASLSLQLHHRRAEHWVVVKGIAEVTNGDEIITLNENQSTFIPVETKHRLRNVGSEALFLIEVQCGDYLGEDDIVRFEDTYGRV